MDSSRLAACATAFLTTARLLRRFFQGSSKIGSATLLPTVQFHLAYDVQPCRHIYYAEFIHVDDNDDEGHTVGL